ncbi:NARE ribosyltransferase, partial [Cisticola juncidis]|nr:NARE ribosyltransferase [Cisticola juncidis]
CGPAMAAGLQDLIHSEFQKNPAFANLWAQAVAEWQKRGASVSPLPSQDHAIALMAFTMGLYGIFNIEVLQAGRSPQHYRDNFHYKSLHFLLTQALAVLREPLKGQCLDVFRQQCGDQVNAQRGDTVRFGQFLITSLKKSNDGGCSEETEFQVRTCHGAGIQSFSEHPEYEWVLIPPYETFEVTEVTQEGGRVKIQLRSNGISSNYNCEWLKGDSTGDSLG